MSADTKTLLDALGKPFPQEAIKTREGSRGKGFSYVAGHTIIHRLNDATGGRWDWEIKSFDFRPLPPNSKGKDQWLVVVTGTLGIPGLGNRSGVGVQVVVDGAGEDLVKGASTDALKKAATLFGVALELYGEDYEAGDELAAMLDLLAEMDADGQPWAAIKQYGDDESAKQDESGKARIKAALHAIAGRRKSAAALAPPAPRPASFAG